MLLHKKNDSRDASSTSLIGYTVPAGTCGGSGSMRKRNCGLTSSAANANSNPRIEITLCAPLPKELKRPDQVLVANGTSPCATRQRAKYLLRAVRFVRVTVGTADEDAPAAGCVTWARGRERARDRDLIHRRVSTRMAVHVEMRLIRLPAGLQERRRLSQERDTQLMWSRLDAETCLEMGVHLTVVISLRRLDDEQFHAFSIQQHLQFVLTVQALDVFVAVTGQSDSDLVLAILRKIVRYQRPAPRSDGQPQRHDLLE